MLEFSVVLMIKRIVELPKNQFVNDISRANIVKGNPNSCQVSMIDKSKPRNNHQSNVGFDDDEEEANTRTRRSYAITDVVDFTAIFIFFVSYILFNCIYMVYYM